MSQYEVFDFLRVRRLTGDERYWRKYEIARELIKTGKINNTQHQTTRVGRQTNKLYAHGFLEIKQDPVCFMIQSYRIKKKYVALETPDNEGIWLKESGSA